MRSRLVFGLACLSGGLALGCPVPAVFQPDEPTRTAGAPLPATVGLPELGRPPAAPRPRVRVLWHDPIPPERLHTGVSATLSLARHVSSILGVDPQHRHAYFTRSAMSNDDFFEVVDAPLSAEHPASPPIARWIGGRDAGYGAFHPFGGDFRSDLLRFAAIVEEVGPWVTRSRGGHAGPHVAVAKDALFFEAPNDELHVANRDGTRARKFVSTAAAYDPQISGDGKTVAFRGCHYVSQVPNKITRCEYHLYIAGPSDPKPDRIEEVDDPQPPIFSADGRYVYAVTHDSNYVSQPYDRGGCLFRVDVAPPRAATKLWCTTAHSGLELSPDPTAATVVVTGSVLGSDRYVRDVLWFDMPSGELRNRVSIERGGSLSALGRHGLFVTSAPGGFAFVDLAKGKVIVAPERRTDFTLLSQHWADDTSVYALRQRAGREPVEEIVALDVRAALDEPAADAP